ncbi:MAG: hypothetical protein HY476_00845 [Nitrosarchaeum sp.]|nr:hypothetical protein [Nitrosarchaeum sp.]
MAKSKSKQTPVSNHLPIGLFTISYQPFFPRGSKRKIRDENGKLIHNLENSTITTNHIYTKDELDNVIQTAKEKGYKKVRKNELTIDLPRLCPICHRLGSPSKSRPRFRIKDKMLDDIEKNKLSQKYLLKYSHSTSPEKCHIGFIDISKQDIKITLNKKLPINALTYSARIGTYPL